ncbi:DUF2474 family protein [Methylorubrum extorquens]|uniref:DUF2474 family protein n=1 Tax=Methylorubrum extorquens TaxID=408 RepID=UPI0002F7E432|nr:DUF2474 family protein [Methylorubrum extorquens]KQP92906.1 hypothetical protein ASF55_21470 [Methylobacterium sp. Leaf119]WIU38811.1 DUF2474 family protein [Methylorubrum extorquens]
MGLHQPTAEPAFGPDAARVRSETITGKLRRIGWFVLLWTMSVVSLTLIALPLRWLLKST